MAQTLIQPGFAEQVCTTTTFAPADDFNGISGSDDGNVIAVGKDGTIAHWDGTTWSAMTSPTSEDLFDVEVVSALSAYAVGKKGVVLNWNGTTWSSMSTPTDRDLNGVWSDSATEAWAVGKNGSVLYYGGSAWTDVSAAAGTGARELVDVWGDSASVLALDKEGVVYRYDRVSGSWVSPDATCDVGGGNFEDLWGDGSGAIYLVKKDDVYLHDGATCTAVASASKDLLGIYGGGGVVVAVGKEGRVLEHNGASWTETDEGIDDLRDVWVSSNGNAYYAGKKGELTACSCVDCVTPEFRVSHDGNGLFCLDELVTVNVVDAISGAPYAGFGGEITLDTQSGTGTWALSTGSGSLSDTTPNDGIATYLWPAGESDASFTLSYREGVDTLDVDVFESVDPSMRDDDSEGTLLFAASGFTLTAAPLPNPPPAVIAPFSGPVTAGLAFPVYLTAYGQTPSDPTCGVIESYNGPRTLKFWSTYADPATGSVAVLVDGNAVATSEGGAVAQGVGFVDGQAVVSARYKDVGRMRLSLKDDSGAWPDLPGGIRGATAPFVSRPARFVLSNISAGATPNPGAVDASGPVFVAAGESFSVTVTAVDADGDPTPNYGREAAAETVALTSMLVAPLSGNNPAIASASGFGAFAAGQASGSFSWPEVGIVQLLPAVGDGDYLGAGDVVGDPSGNVGRFIPHHFATTLNTPVLDTACDSGGFTYLGEPFGYTVAPVVTLFARTAANITTTNYTGAFWRLDNASLGARTYTSATGTLDTSGLPPATSDPLIVDAGGGTGTMVFSAGSGLAMQRASPQPPFDAEITLSFDLLDSDAVAASVNPVQFGAPGGIAFDAGRSMRYGRIAVASALGSERVDLPVAMQAQYFIDAATGFVRHDDEVCNTVTTLVLSAFAGNLDAGETCVMDVGAPGQSGAGCLAPAPFAWAYREPAIAGDYNLNLAAPGAGNDGALTVTANVPAWLRYDWDSGLAGDEDPSGRVTFGIFRGDDATVYTREIY